jgi:hypothetical protein
LHPAEKNLTRLPGVLATSISIEVLFSKLKYWMPEECKPMNIYEQPRLIKNNSNVYQFVNLRKKNEEEEGGGGVLWGNSMRKRNIPVAPSVANLAAFGRDSQAL